MEHEVKEPGACHPWPQGLGRKVRLCYSLHHKTVPVAHCGELVERLRPYPPPPQALALAHQSCQPRGHRHPTCSRTSLHSCLIRWMPRSMTLLVTNFFHLPTGSWPPLHKTPPPQWADIISHSNSTPTSRAQDGPIHWGALTPTHQPSIRTSNTQELDGCTSGLSANQNTSARPHTILVTHQYSPSFFSCSCLHMAVCEIPSSHCTLC